MTQTIAPTKKAKTTIYMSEEDEKMLDEIFIKRLREKRKLIALPYFAKEFAFYTKWESAMASPQRSRFPSL